MDMAAEAWRERFAKRLQGIRREQVEQFSKQAGEPVDAEPEAFFGKLAAMTGEQIAAQSATLEAELFDILQGHKAVGMEDYRRYAIRRLEQRLFNRAMVRAMIRWVEEAGEHYGDVKSGSTLAIVGSGSM